MEQNITLGKGRKRKKRFDKRKRFRFNSLLDNFLKEHIEVKQDSVCSVLEIALYFLDWWQHNGDDSLDPPTVESLEPVIGSWLNEQLLIDAASMKVIKKESHGRWRGIHLKRKEAALKEKVIELETAVQSTKERAISLKREIDTMYVERDIEKRILEEQNSTKEDVVSTVSQQMEELKQNLGNNSANFKPSKDWLKLNSYAQTAKKKLIELGVDITFKPVDGKGIIFLDFEAANYNNSHQCPVEVALIVLNDNGIGYSYLKYFPTPPIYGNDIFQSMWTSTISGATFPLIITKKTKASVIENAWNKVKTAWKDADTEMVEWVKKHSVTITAAHKDSQRIEKNYVLFAKDPTLENKLLSECFPELRQLVHMTDIRWFCNTTTYFDWNLKLTAPELEKNCVFPCSYHKNAKQINDSVHCALEDVRHYALALKKHRQTPCEGCFSKEKYFQ